MAFFHGEDKKLLKNPLFGRDLRTRPNPCFMARPTSPSILDAPPPPSKKIKYPKVSSEAPKYSEFFHGANHPQILPPEEPNPKRRKVDVDVVAAMPHVVFEECGVSYDLDRNPDPGLTSWIQRVKGEVQEEDEKKRMSQEEDESMEVDEQDTTIKIRSDIFENSSDDGSLASDSGTKKTAFLSMIESQKKLTTTSLNANKNKLAQPLQIIPTSQRNEQFAQNLQNDQAALGTIQNYMNDSRVIIQTVPVILPQRLTGPRKMVTFSGALVIPKDE